MHSDHRTAENPEAAREIVLATLGRDPGPMAAVRSDSHHVYVSPRVVVKIIDADRHSRLDREVALAPLLPPGLMAPLLTSGLYRLGTRDVRFACYARVRGEAPGMGLPGVSAATAHALAEDAIRMLEGVHSWIPTGHARQTLSEPLDHGGFVSRAELFAGLDTPSHPGSIGFRAGSPPRRSRDDCGASSGSCACGGPSSCGLSLGKLASVRWEDYGVAGFRMGSLGRTGR
jgi:hypothetical protein